MGIKNIYFVRHGQSEANLKGVRQGLAGDLTDFGRKQADYVGRRLKTLPIEAIISSTSPRASQTAEIINQYLKVPFQSSPLLVEKGNPSSILGQLSSQDSVIEIQDLIFDRFITEPDFHYEDAESFTDLKNRARKALALIANFPADNIAVVTHGAFLRMLMLYIFYQDEVLGRDYINFFGAVKTTNTGVTWCTYNPEQDSNPWTLVTYNDQNHLAEF